jgi:cytochrome c-type biogenesis protein CcmH/NrfG
MCQQALAVDTNNIEATLLLADLMYARNEGAEALKHFAQILVDLKKNILKIRKISAKYIFINKL